MGGIGRRFLHGLRDHLQARLPRQRRHPRRPGLVAPEPVHTGREIAFLPSPDGGLGCRCTSHNLVGAPAIRRRQDDLGTSYHLLRCVAVGEQRLKLRTVCGAKIKANVIASHAPNMTDDNASGNLMSGVEHWFEGCKKSPLTIGTKSSSVTIPDVRLGRYW